MLSKTWSNREFLLSFNWGITYTFYVVWITKTIRSSWVLFWFSKREILFEQSSVHLFEWYRYLMLCIYCWTMWYDKEFNLSRNMEMILPIKLSSVQQICLVREFLGMVRSGIYHRMWDSDDLRKLMIVWGSHKLKSGLWTCCRGWQVYILFIRIAFLQSRCLQWRRILLSLFN